MLARWYNTDTGQFDTRDTAGNNLMPDSVDAKRLTTTDPTAMLDRSRRPYMALSRRFLATLRSR